MTNQTITIEDAKAAARAELEAYRARKRADEAAREAASRTVEDEIAAEIQAHRAEEERRAETDAARKRLYARRDAEIAARKEAELQQKLTANPRLRIAQTPERRLAKLLRKRMGDDFDAFAADLRLVNFGLFRAEIRRIPDDERAEAAHREQEARAARLVAEASALPQPESPEEVAILRKHGFVTPAYVLARRAELDAGAL